MRIGGGELKLIKDLTWPEIRESSRNGAIVVLPTGSIEQHGYHLPTQTDTLLVESVVQGAVEIIGRVEDPHNFLIAPTIWLGASDHHKPFFALSLREETYIDMIIDIAGSIAEAGFRRLFIVNGHGGNSAPLRVALSGLKRTAPDLMVATGNYWSIAASGLRALRKSNPGGAAHAGEIETSLMLHLAPGSVRSEAAPPSVPDTPDGFEIDLIDAGSIVVNLPWNALSERGHIGDPTLATADAGDGFFKAAIRAVATALVGFANYRSE